MRELDYGEFDYDELESDSPPPPFMRDMIFINFLLVILKSANYIKKCEK
ncbi:hypothetical protein ACWIUD_09345 [Helicobacter sp. 23-1044]